MKIRSMICAPKGYYLLSCDLAQAESWVVAYEADDSEMKNGLLSGDIHTKTAIAINELPLDAKPTSDQRYVGKRTNHASAYGMEPPRFVQVFNSDSPFPISITQATKYQRLWHELYSRIKPWWREIELELKMHDGIIQTAYGRRIQFLGPQDKQLLKKAIACKPQSTIADHFRGRLQPYNEIPGGLLEFSKRIESFSNEIQIVQQGHDSALVIVPKPIIMDIAHLFRSCLLRPIIIKGESVNVPVDGEYGERWGELEKIKWSSSS